MTLQRLVVPVLLIALLILAACGGAEPAITTEPVVEAVAAEVPTATEAPAAEVASSTTTTETTNTETTNTETTNTETTSTESEATSYVVDAPASTVTWYGSKPIGASETGTVTIAEGQLNFTGDQLVDGTITIDMATIATTSQTGGMAKQLVEHLASDDFFGIATYPTAKLTLKSAEATETANQYRIKADLTIKATTKEIEFVANVTVSDGTLTAASEVIINRADFDVRYNSGAFFSGLGDNLISDEMKITIAFVAKKS